MWKTLDRLRRWLSPPGFEDKEKARRARLLNTVFLTVFLLQLISLLIDFLAGNGDWLLLLVYLVGLTITLGLWALMRRGQLRLASQGLVISTWLLVTIFVVVNGTIRSPVTSLYLLVIVTAGLILDRRAVILFTMLCSLTVLGLVIAENEGLFPWQEFSVTFEQWATYTLFFIVAALFVLLAVQDIVFSLASASRELDERQKIEVTLRESEERYRNFIEHSFEGVWQMSFDDPISTGLPLSRLYYRL
jgi:PAS domain-containing protein